MTWAIPLTDIEVTDDDVEAVLECLRSGWLTMGPRVQELEREFAAYVGTEHAIAVSSGTAALHLAALAAGVGSGDEVIVPNFTFVASATAARYCGATPVLCDSLGPDDMNLDVEDVRAQITNRTRAIVAVHLMGYPCHVEALRTVCHEHGLSLIEDAAHAIGASTPSGRSVGTVGHLGCFSFFSKKQLCVGEGGMVVTADPELAAKVKLLRSHGMTSVTWDRHQGYAETYDVIDIGFNYRMDEPRAALGLSRLKRLDDDIASRRAHVRRYRRAFEGHPNLHMPWNDDDVARSSHFAFPLLLADRATRDHVRGALSDAGMQTSVYPAITELSAYDQRATDASLSRSRELAERHCVLPLASIMSDTDVDAVADAVLALVDDEPAGEARRRAAASS